MILCDLQQFPETERRQLPIFRETMKMMRIATLVGLTGLCLSGCSRESGNAVAKVGSSTLTRQELEALVPPELSRYATRDGYLDLVRGWIQTRVLADEARRRGLTKDPEVRRLLDEQRDELLAQILVQRTFDSVPDPSDAGIRRYYDAHQNDFLRLEPEVTFMQVRFPDQTTAAAFRAHVTPGTFAREAARIDPETARSPQSMRSYRRGELSPAAGDALFGLREGEISSPVQDQDGWHVYHLLSRAAAGTVRPLTTVQDAIVARLREDDRRLRMQNWVAELCRTRKIRIWEDRLPGPSSDASVQKNVKP